jgi:hypothetical protein
MRTLIARNLIITGVVTASLAFGANGAIAAAPQAHKPATASHVTHAQSAHTASFGGWGSAQTAPTPAGTGWGWGGTRAAKAPAYGVRQAARYAAGGYLPRNQFGLDINQFIQGMLSGGPVPYANLARDVEQMHGVRGGGSHDYLSPSYDNSAPVAVGDAAQAAQAASDAENQTVQEINDVNAQTASMAAAEAANDAANAATLQTEINAGM